MLTKLFTALTSLFFAISAMAGENVVLVDDAHMQLSGDATAKISYSINASQEMILDLGEYTFSLWPKEEPAPDTVSIVIANNQQYYLKLRAGTKKYSLSQSTLVPRSGSRPFKGFVSGQKLIVAIGRLRIDHVKKEEALRVHWVGLVDVK